MQNTRRYERYKANLIGINGRIILAKFVKIIDISIGGLSLQTEKRLNIGNEYTLKIDSKEKVFTVKGIVVWSVLNNSIKDSKGNIVPLYTAGIKFTNVSGEKINEITDFMQTYKRDIDHKVNLFSPSGRRLYVRIHVTTPENGVLNCHEDYKVKILSLGGMLIESSHPLEVESTLPMEIIFPEYKSILFQGRVAACLQKKVKDLLHYDIGIDFVNMTEKDKEILHEIIRLLKTTNDSSRAR
ncbi:MAG: PilZ domain-containing protein [Nitrospira sp.]|nr:PilZ domain-containing protein [Nitrospira sp.]